MLSSILHLLQSQPLLSLQPCYIWLLKAPVVQSFNFQARPRSTSTQAIKNSINKMMQAPQTQPVFVDIHMNNGYRLGARTFSDILNGRFNGDKQLAFEQYLGDFKVYGTAYRTYRYAIVNGNMLLLDGVFNPLPAGPALAAPVTQSGPQHANAQTQNPVYRSQYASQFNQPAAIPLGPVDPSTVQNMRYPTASTAQRSVPQLRQLNPLNPYASEFRLDSAVSNVGASSRPSALPAANSAPVRPPGLPLTQQPQFAASNAHRGSLSSNIIRPLSHDNGEAARAEAGHLKWTAPYTSLAHSHDPAVHQQPQLTPFNARQGHLVPDTLPSMSNNRREAAGAAAEPSVLVTPYSPILLTHVRANPQQSQFAPSNARRSCLKLNTGLGLSSDDEEAGAPASPSALATNFFTASRDSRMASPSPLDLAAVSSDNPHWSPRQGDRRTSEHSSDLPSHSSSDNVEIPFFRTSAWSSYHTANSSVSKANATQNTLPVSQDGGADIGVAPFPPAPSYISWNPALEYSRGQYEPFYSIFYGLWLRSAAPGSGKVEFYNHLKYSVPNHIRRYNDSHGLRDLQSPATTSSRVSSDLPPGTVSHRTEPPTVGNALQTPRKVSTSAPPAPTEGGPNVSPRNSLYLTTSLHHQLHYGDDESKSDGSSCADHQSPVDRQPEAQSSNEVEDEDWRLQQRLSGHSHALSNTVGEILTTMRDVEVASG